MPGSPSSEGRGGLSSEALQSGVFRRQAEHFALLGPPVYGRIDELVAGSPIVEVLFEDDAA